jgi:hypothetical protein
MAHDERRFRNGTRFLIKAHNQQLPSAVVPMPLERAYAASKVPRFAIVRHPITRLLSGWLGKIAGHDSQNARTLPIHFVPSAPLNATFGSFVKHVVSHPRFVLANGHFRLQSQQCAGREPGVRPWRILRLEEVGAWYEAVACTLGVAEVASRGWETFATTHGRARYHGQACMVRTACGCTINCARPCTRTTNVSLGVEHASFHNADALVQRYYTPVLALIVNRWAAPDYAAFRYAPWIFGTRVAKAPLPLSP